MTKKHLFLFFIIIFFIDGKISTEATTSTKNNKLTKLTYDPKHRNNMKSWTHKPYPYVSLLIRWQIILNPIAWMASKWATIKIETI